ncbi:MAG: hypothetical protein AAGD35_04185 [Actinomycetota bacterium]
MQTDAEALAVFDGKSLSYTYEGGMSVTNVFKGADRETEFGGETLVEQVTVKNVAPNTYYIVWEDAVRGLATQTVNLDTNSVCTAITMDGNIAVMPGSITSFEAS